MVVYGIDIFEEYLPSILIEHSFFKKIIYLFIRDREKGRDTGRGRNLPPRRELDVGLDPETPGSHPGLKAGAKPLSHLGISFRHNSFWPHPRGLGPGCESPHLDARSWVAVGNGLPSPGLVSYPQEEGGIR